MQLWDVLKKVGSVAIRAAVPGGGVVLDLINEFLPDDKKLPPHATGEQALQAIEALPPDQRSRLLEKELDVEIAEINSWTSIMDTLAKADMAGSSTRPWIAKLMAVEVFLVGTGLAGAFLAVLLNGDTATLDKLNDSWATILAVLGTPTALLRAYFGMREREKKARYALAAGRDPQAGGLVGLLQGLFGGNN